MSDHDLTAREAADQLGISLATLYAYVSRGLIHSQPGPTGSRARRYRAADVLALRERQAQRRDPARSAETALNWGTPVLESSITLIENGRLYYRGHDAIRLARTRHFEEVVRLLWTGKFDEGPRSPLVADHRERPRLELPPGLGALERMQALLPLMAQADPGAYDLRTQAVTRAGASILRSMAEEIAGGALSGSIAQTLASNWAPATNRAELLIDAALIVSADHELNPSSFTVRCVASAGAPLYDAIGAGLGAMRGVRHGAISHRIGALLAEVQRPERASSVLEDRLRRGEPIPGFGHHVYPDGDPRGALLIDLCHELVPDHRSLHLTDAIVSAAGRLIGELPTIDFGLVAVSQALGLESGAAVSLMTLGRTAGWVAHALEQYQREGIIRPRARYMGPAPLRSESTEAEGAVMPRNNAG